MATKISTNIVEDGKNFINILQESMAGAQESVQASRDRAEIMLRLLQGILDNAEELSRQSKDTAKAAIEMSQEVINRLNEICTAAEEDAKNAKKALDDAINIAQTRSDSVMNIAWSLSRAAREAIEAPGKEAKSKWWDG